MDDSDAAMLDTLMLSWTTVMLLDTYMLAWRTVMLPSWTASCRSDRPAVKLDTSVFVAKEVQSHFLSQNV